MALRYNREMVEDAHGSCDLLLTLRFFGSSRDGYPAS